MVRVGNLFASIPAAASQELFETLAAHAGASIERIVSTGQASPPGFWYNQDWTEWVVVLQGSADLLVEGETAPRRLLAGDWIELPAHLRHRVERTDRNPPTMWLAVHWK